MCDALVVDNMDDLIEYELTRDGIIEEDDCDIITTTMSIPSNSHGLSSHMYPTDDYEILEELYEEIDEAEVDDVKPMCIKPDIYQDSNDGEGNSNNVNYSNLMVKSEKIDYEDEDQLIEQDDGGVSSALNQFILSNGSYNNVESLDNITEVLVQTDDDGGDDTALQYHKVPKKIVKTKTVVKKRKQEDLLQSSEDDNDVVAPRRYLLFDELVACIVDYDEDGTPIVEFSISNSTEDEKLAIECGICQDVMNRYKLPLHLKTHLVAGTTNRYKCMYCEETYKDWKYLAGHARRHLGIRPYVCVVCKLYFSTKQDLRVHNQRRHQKKDHVCELCGKSFSQNTQLKRHRESTHEKMRRFQCDLCPKSYYKNFSLQEHIRAVHMGKRRMIVCPFCGMQCRDAHKMARHRKQMHLNQTQFECTICNEEFTDINYFDAHKRSIQCRNNTRRKLEEQAMLQVNKSSATAVAAAAVTAAEQEVPKQKSQQTKTLLKQTSINPAQEYYQENQLKVVPMELLDSKKFFVTEQDLQHIQILNEHNIKTLLPNHHQIIDDDDDDDNCLTNHYILGNELDLIHQDLDDPKVSHILTNNILNDNTNDNDLVFEITIDNSND